MINVGKDVGMWGKGTYLLLVGMQTGTIAVEVYVEDPQETQDGIAI